MKTLFERLHVTSATIIMIGLLGFPFITLAGLLVAAASLLRLTDRSTRT